MAELEASWAGTVQARSHWYIPRYRELGLAMTPTLLPPQEPWWAATAWCGVWGFQRPAAPRRVSLLPFLLQVHLILWWWEPSVRRIAHTLSDVTKHQAAWVCGCEPASPVCLLFLHTEWETSYFVYCKLGSLHHEHGQNWNQELWIAAGEITLSFVGLWHALLSCMLRLTWEHSHWQDKQMTV